MNQITGFPTVPSTISSMISSTPTIAAAAAMSTVTTTTTETVFRTLSATSNRAVSTAVANVKLSASSVSPTVPAHLLNSVINLYIENKKQGLFHRGFTNMGSVFGAMLGVSVVGGSILYVGKKLQKMIDIVPPGQEPRTWREKVNFAYRFLKGSANINLQLNRAIAQAHRERNTALNGAQTAQERLHEAWNKIEDLEKDLDKNGGREDKAIQDQIDAETNSTRLREELQKVRAELEAHPMNTMERDTDELRGDLEEAHKHADGLQVLLDRKEEELATAHVNAKTLLDKVKEDLRKVLEDPKNKTNDLRYQDQIIDLQTLDEQNFEDKLEAERMQRIKVEDELEAERARRTEVEEQLVDEEIKRAEFELQFAEEETKRFEVEQELAALKGSRSQIPDQATKEDDTSRPHLSTGRKNGLDASPPVPSSAFRNTSPQMADERSEPSGMSSKLQLSQQKTPSPANSSPLSEASIPSLQPTETPSRKRVRGQKPDEEETTRPIKRRATPPKSMSATARLEADQMEVDEVKAEHNSLVNPLQNKPDLARPDRLSTRIQAPTFAPVGSQSPRKSIRNAGKLQNLSERSLSQRSMSPSKDQVPAVVKSPTRRQAQASPSKISKPAATPRPAPTRQTRSQSPEKGLASKIPKKR